MKSTGIVRKIDNLGRLVLPKELRKILEIEEGTPLEIFTEGNSIILKKFEINCKICGQTNDLAEFGTIKICKECRTKIFNKVTGE